MAIFAACRDLFGLLACHALIDAQQVGEFALADTMHARHGMVVVGASAVAGLAVKVTARPARQTVGPAHLCNCGISFHDLHG